MNIRQEKRRDFYHREAKDRDYRARSAFKLKEMQKKYSIIKPGDKVVDLGAAPGSWSQVALEFIDGGKVIAVDKLVISKLNGNFKAIRGDFTDEDTVTKIKEHLSGKADVVLCDASPTFTGIKSMDIGLSLELNKSALDVAAKLLRIKGRFVCKTFRGPGFQDFLKDIKRQFTSVHMFKPKSSKKGSSEIYIVSVGFRKVRK